LLLLHASAARPTCMQLLMSVQQTRRSHVPAMIAPMQFGKVLLMLLALLQLLLLQKRVTLYFKLRHSLIVLQRTLRTLMCLLPALVQRYDVMTRWMHASQHPVAYILGGYVLFMPMMQLQVSVLVCCVFGSW
jgi:hypothetical protein